MGWKISLIIITNPSTISHKELLTGLGLKRFSETGSGSIEEASTISNKKTYIGDYKGQLVIHDWTIPEKIILQNNTPEEKFLASRFPNSEIAVMELVSTINFWGYKILKDGKVLRHRAGDADKGTYFDLGDPLEEEKPLLAQSYINEEGERMYRMEDMPGEEFNEDQVGENFVFEIGRRYLGRQLDMADDFLWETPLTEYSKKPWWKLA